MSRQTDQYDQYSDYLDQLSPYARKKMGKKSFKVYDESGNLIMPAAINKFPASAAKKAVSKGYTKIVIYDPVKNRWYGYIGKKCKIPSNKLSQHQKEYGIKFTPKAYSHKIEDVAKPSFLREILGGEEVEEESFYGEDDDGHEYFEEEKEVYSPRGGRWF
jgi:hypothetical protein